MSAIVEKIKEQFSQVESERSEMKGRVELLREQVDSAKVEIKKLNGEYATQEAVLDVLRKYAAIKEQVLKEKIDKVVTRGLRLIFGDQYRSKLEFGISRGQAVIRPRIVTEINGEELETDIADAHGGGLVNVCAVIYQILILALHRPRKKQILFLDEPFKNLSEEYLEATGEFLKQLNQKLGIQIVLITHRRELHDIADKMYEFSLSDGITQVKAVRE